MRDHATELFQENLLSEPTYNKIKETESNPLFSLFWELRTLLYLGVLLFTGGLGIVVYQNIDTIGHQAILAVIALCCLGCFYYRFKNGQKFGAHKIKHDSPFFDYVLLTGCLLFITFEGYIQFQYEVFGIRYGLAAIIPTLVCVFSSSSLQQKLYVRVYS